MEHADLWVLQNYQSKLCFAKLELLCSECNLGRKGGQLNLGRKK